MYILGVWDGHDSGAAIVEGKKILFAANEERYTKRKLEVAFPYNSIRAALRYTGLKPSDIEVVSFPTTEFTKTISRIFPGAKENYYQFRRRKVGKPALEGLMHYSKYAMTLIGDVPLSRTISKELVAREMRGLGFRDFRIFNTDHHMSHAATAAFTSGMKNSLSVTLDGLGDGLSGSVCTFEHGELKREHSITARNSIGIFFEQVTNLVGMRELEDEGKVMAMADYSFPFDFSKNKMREFFKVEGKNIVAKYGPVEQYRKLGSICWNTPREQFAYMAQQLLEHIMEKFFSNVIDEYGKSAVSMAGGLLSNVKANMKVREIESLKQWHIFPHMGDGGIALGSAMFTNYLLNDVTSYEFNDAYLGEDYSEKEILSHLKKTSGITYEKDTDSGGHAADLLEDQEYVFWFNGRMEYGPRALGNRSIVARADSDSVKDKLNLFIKQREWYQPFAPSMLYEDANKLLYSDKGKSSFMTMAYAVRESERESMKSVVHVDLTARPQMLEKENKQYRRLMEAVKKHTGRGVVLNTSFNIHGSPIVSTPADAIDTMKKTKAPYMFLSGYFVENKDGKK